TLRTQVNDRFANAHFSQIQAVETVLKALVSPQQELLGKMDPAGDKAVFVQSALEVVQRTVLAQQFWDYFREKLELRFSPRFNDPLWVADTVAYDCYTSVLAGAVAAGIRHEGDFREPPLTYLSTETSPLTWLRSQMPMQDGIPAFADGSLKLPFAVIQLPWD